MDFAGPFQGRMFFIVVDAHSKWPEVVEMTTTTTADTLKALRKMFVQYGLPEQMVSDNGPQFISAEFATFAKKNGIKHIRCAPYHPSSNGLAEYFIQTFKRAMKASEKDGRSPSHRLAEFLMTYRATPHATTGVAPTTLFLQRQKSALALTSYAQMSRGVFIDHIRTREYEITAPPSTLVLREPSSEEPDDAFYGPEPLEGTPPVELDNAEGPPPQPLDRRYPARDRRPPDRLDPSTT